MKLLKIALVGITLHNFILTVSLNAQVNQEWMSRYEHGIANSMVIDDAENVYVTGRTGSYTDSLNYATIKYDKLGSIQWIAFYNHNVNDWDEAKSIAVDKSGNVYVTGISFTIENGFDYLTVKYNSSGIEQWTKRYNGATGSNDYAISVKLDGDENVFVLGYSKGNGTDYDYATIKYNSLGEELWIRRYNGTGNFYDKATSMALDDSGNVYVTGYSDNEVAWYDYLTIKYSSSGVEQWVARFNSFEFSIARATSVKVDKSCNVYVTGECIYDSTYLDYVTIKYNSYGNLQWSAVYDGPAHENDFATSLAIDTLGNVCVTGYSNYDYATVMYDSNGIQKWVARYAGGEIYDEAYAVALDQSGNAYVTGGASGIIDPFRYKYTTIKYDINGVQKWLQVYSDIGRDAIANSISIGKSGAVYISGQSGNSFLTIKYSQTTGVNPVNFATPTNYELFQNYPNPFNPITVIEFLLPERSFVTLRVFDINGKIVSELVNENLSAGIFQYEFNATNFSSGVYFYKLETGSFSQTKKMMLTK